MSSIIKCLVITTAILGSINFYAQKANAVTFNFTQEGWSAGGIVTGSFSGEDSDNDGLILTEEVTDFSLDWSGNPLVPQFSLDFSNLIAWQFSLADQRLIYADSSGGTIFWNYDDKIPLGNVGIVGFASTEIDTTIQAPSFSAVPEPITLLGTGTALLFGSVFKRNLSSKKQK